MEKKEIRKTILKKRRALDENEVKYLSDMICEKLKSSDIDAEDLCLYMPINNEVDVPVIAEEARRQGKRLWLPRVDGETMDFFRYDEDTVLVTGSYDIMEPDSDEMLEPDENTLIIMPGAVFSESRDRIGYGGGYYDRFLCKFKGLSAGLCYDKNVLKSIDFDEYDVSVDCLVTESGIKKINRRRKDNRYKRENICRTY